jgi:hypothetical protein
LSGFRKIVVFSLKTFSILIFYRIFCCIATISLVSFYKNRTVFDFNHKIIFWYKKNTDFNPNRSKVGGKREKSDLKNVLLNDFECSEYVIFKVRTHMRMDRDPHTLLGQCPKFDQIFSLMASLISIVLLAKWIDIDVETRVLLRNLLKIVLFCLVKN